MKLKQLAVVALMMLAVAADAQTLGEFKPKETSFGLGRVKGEKKIYIAGFFVNFQIYNEQEDFKQGGYQLGGGHKGDASAQLAVGLSGLTEETVKQITDKLYADYVAMLKDKGLTIITPDEAAKTETYSEFARAKGGISTSQFPGTMTVAPTGFEFFYKKADKSGKTTAGNPALLYPKLSNDMGDAIITDVNLFVMFVEGQNAFKGAGANIKVKTSLRIAGTETIAMASDAKIKFKGQNTYTTINSGVNFYHGKKGLGATTAYNGILGKSYYINGVIEDTKIQSFAKGSTDYVGTSTMFGTYYSGDDRTSSKTKLVAADDAKYNEWVYKASKEFIDHHTKAFLSEI